MGRGGAFSSTLIIVQIIFCCFLYTSGEGLFLSCCIWLKPPSIITAKPQSEHATPHETAHGLSPNTLTRGKEICERMFLHCRLFGTWHPDHQADSHRRGSRAERVTAQNIAQAATCSDAIHWREPNIGSCSSHMHR